VLKDKAMSRVGGLMDCCSPGEDLRAPHNDIDISSIPLQMRPVISAAIRSPGKNATGASPIVAGSISGLQFPRLAQRDPLRGIAPGPQPLDVFTLRPV
jgi:hypothetical protein